jgi:CspA family cold shock protein
MQGPTEYTCLQLPGAHDNTTEKNVDKIKIGDNIINRGGEKLSGSSGEIFIGIVKWFSPEKGFGFVTCSDGNDIFVYYTEIQTEGFKTLQKGQKVQLELFAGERGPQASNVRLA